MAIAGKICGVYVGANKVLAVTSAKFSKKGKEIDVTSFSSSGMEEFILGLQGADLSIDGIYDSADTTGQVAIRDNTTTLSMEVRYGATTPKVAFTAIVTGFDLDASVGDAVKFSATCKPTGALPWS
jgi:hypothetical protein